MSDDTVAVAELSSYTLQWTSPDWARLTEAMHRRLVPFVGPGLRFRGNVVLEGDAKITRSYDAVEKWTDALTAHIKSADCWLSATGARSLSLGAYHSDGRFNLRISVPESDLPAAEELFAQLRAEIGLRDEKEASAQSTTYLERNYLVEKQKDAAWCLAALDFLLPAQRGFNGRIEFGTPAGLGQSFGNREEWLKAVAAEWGSIIRLDCNTYEKTERESITWNMQSSNFRVKLERPADRKVLSDFEALESELSLRPTDGGFARSPLEGAQRTYFAPRDADSSWFDRRVVPAVLSAIGGDFYLDLTVRHGPGGRETLSWQAIDKWRQFVIEKWQGIADLRAYLSGPGLTLDLRYENFHERVTLEVRTPSRQATDRLVAQFVEQLGLEALDEARPWQVRTTAVYDVPPFSNEIFAAELTALVRQLFPGKYMRYEVSILEPIGEVAGKDDKQTVTQYESLPLFLARLGDDKGYSEVHLRLEGPRGKTLFVDLTGGGTKLQIRSSERPGDFSRILKPLEKRLRLARVSVTPTAPEKKTLKDSVWILLALPMFTAILTGTVLSDTFRGWVTTKPRLEIVSPPDGVVSPIIQVRWQIQTESFGSKHMIDDSKASFRIMREGIEVVRKDCVASGEEVKLTPGKHSIVVNSCGNYGESAKLQFEVKAPSP